MKNKRLKLHEDITPVSAIDKNATLEDIYDELGDDLFDDANIQYLKDSGLIDKDGYPVSTYVAYDDSIRHGRYDCEDIYANFEGAIDKPYIQELFMKEIHIDMDSDAGGVYFNYQLEDLPRFDNLSENFIQGCFEENVWEFFWDNFDISFNDCSFVLDDIPEDILDELERVGFPRDIFTQLYNGEADEDSKLAKFYDDLEMALRRAVEDAYASGSADECQRDFNEAWNDSIPGGCIWEEGFNPPDRKIKVSENYIREHLAEIWDYYDRYASAGECVRFFVIETINDELKSSFREPYYGWNEYDESAFESSLHDSIAEIDFEEPQPEEDLLKFNGDKGDYEEDLDEDITPVQLPATAPKKLYYKYKEYTPELSSKAYQLDLMRVNMLLDWAKENNKELYTAVNNKVDDDIREVGEYLSGIIISAIKPSYAETYYPDGYTIWCMSFIDYEVEYLGSIPLAVGKHILSGVPITEGIEVIPVPMDEELHKGIPLNIQEEVDTDTYSYYEIWWVSSEEYADELRHNPNKFFYLADHAVIKIPVSAPLPSNEELVSFLIDEGVMFEGSVIVRRDYYDSEYIPSDFEEMEDVYEWTGYPMATIKTNSQ